jgi:hypothetical protein
MSSLQPPLVGPREIGRPPADFDALIRAFFRVQMPEPWPVLKPPATPSLDGKAAVPLRRRSLLRSRFALAACLLVLLIGQFVISTMFSVYAPFAADGNRGRLEATNRKTGSVKPRGPKPAGLPQPGAAIPQPRGEGIWISERR